jgi:hypothetical protein
MSEDYCEMCDLPLSTCVHGMPAPPPAPARQAPARATRTRSTATTRATSRSTAPPARRAPRRWTPPEHFRPLIVEVLEEAGGSLPADDVFERLEGRVGDAMLAGDRELTPEGELRWRYAARRARQGLIADGVMEKGAPGVWHLGPGGARTR